MLHWQQDWSTKTAYWEAVIEQGRPAPEPFYERPELLPEAGFYWSAFCDLGTERQLGMGVGPIPQSKAREYANHHDIADEDDFEFFWEIINAVDREYLRLMNSESKNDDETSSTKDHKDLH